MNTEQFAKEVLELLVFEVVNLRAPLGIPQEKRRELGAFAKDFYRDHKELVDAAFKKERERAIEADVDFNIEKFMQGFEPEILRIMPKWLNKHPHPLYGPTC